jgi:hypothetical protein
MIKQRLQIMNDPGRSGGGETDSLLFIGLESLVAPPGNDLRYINPRTNRPETYGIGGDEYLVIVEHASPVPRIKPTAPAS